MKEILFYGKSINQNNEAVLKYMLQNRNENYHNLIITPDRMTLNTEKKIFELSGVNAFFDCDVITISRLSQKILTQNHNEAKILTKPMAIAIIKNLMIENLDSLKVLNKVHSLNGTASTVYENICMFKSCKIKPNEIEGETVSKNLNLKLADLKLLYTKYEEFLKEDFNDSFNRLSLLEQFITKQEFENTNLYFVGFSDFTPQMHFILQKFIKNAHLVAVSVVGKNHHSKGGNNHLISNKCFADLISIGEAVGVKPELVYVTPVISNEQQIIFNSAFSFDVKDKIKSPKYFSCVKFQSPQTELEFVSKYIRHLVYTKNYKYSDFTVICSDINIYKTTVSEVFHKYNIDYYLDVNNTCVSNIVSRFILDYFNLLKYNVSAQDLIHFVKSYSMSTFEQIGKFENEINKIGLNGKQLVQYLINNSNLYLDFSFNTIIEDLLFFSSAKCMDEIINKVNLSLKQLKLDEFVIEVRQQLNANENIIELKELDVVLKKINKSFIELKTLFSNKQFAFEHFFDIFENYLENISIVMPPLIADTVMVADNTSGFCDENKIVIVVGANEGKMPKVLNDVGFITDIDINLLQKKIFLTPTVKEVNQNNRYKTFQNLLLAKDRLLITYVGSNEKGESLMPSNFINSLLVAFGENILNGEDFLNYDEYFKNEPMFLFNNLSIKDAEFNFISHLKNAEYESKNLAYMQNLATLKNVVYNQEELINKNNFINKVKNIENTELFFVDHKTSVSEIENYYACPYKHFASYGLKLLDKDDEVTNPMVFGKILHLFIKTQMNTILNARGNEQKIMKLIENAETEILNILNLPEYHYLKNNPYHKNTIKSLANEAKNLIKAISFEQSISKFVPQNLEYYISNNNILVDNNNKSITLVGVIDRVDVFENEFRVIDYKTGNAEFSNLEEAKLGKKIQLFVYAYLFEKESNLKPAAVFYLPIKNEFIKDGELFDSYKLKGVVKDNLKSVLNMDNTLENNNKSKVLHLKLKEGLPVGGKNGIVVTDKEFDNICNEVMELMKKATLEISKGYIKPNPLKTKNNKACDYCPFLGLCNFNLLYGNEYRIKNQGEENETK